MQRVQVSAPEILPPEQIYILSIVQVELQPSPFPVLPSSHTSLECFNPSPHCIVHVSLAILGEVPPVQRVQVSFAVVDPPVQIYIGSIPQVELQPSPFPEFPSSHSSELCFNPSPQFITQASLAVLGDRPPAQIEQASIEDIDPPEHTCIVSISQVELHPSPFPIFPSSHCSVECFKPSPH